MKVEGVIWQRNDLHYYKPHPVMAASKAKHPWCPATCNVRIVLHPWSWHTSITHMTINIMMSILMQKRTTEVWYWCTFGLTKFDAASRRHPVWMPPPLCMCQHQIKLKKRVDALSLYHCWCHRLPSTCHHLVWMPHPPMCQLSHQIHLQNNDVWSTISGGDFEFRIVSDIIISCLNTLLTN